MSSIGILPYAVVESAQQLAVVFRLLRLEPEDTRLRELALHYAGLMSHFSADLCQPLHTTVHHDGRVTSMGTSPGSGIHDATDRLFDRVPVEFELSDSPIEFEPVGLFEATIAELDHSHGEVDRLYELGDAILAAGEGATATPELVSFANDRFRASVLFTARLLMSAWSLSEAVEMPTD